MKNTTRTRFGKDTAIIPFSLLSLPYDKPAIALAILVENGGFGAQAAAPAARKILDYYLVERLKAKEEAGQHKEETKKEDKDKEQKTKKVQVVRKTPTKTTSETKGAQR